MEKLFKSLFSGESLPPGADLFSLGHEGWSWRTAGIVFAGLMLLAAWGYVRSARGVWWPVRGVLLLLRGVLFATLLLLLVRPVLLLPIEETTRRSLLVLLDVSRSMELADQRKTPDDLAREALARGAIDPARGVQQTIPARAPDAQPLSRKALLEVLAANPKLALWPRLQANADVMVYGAGRQLGELGPLAPRSLEAGPLTTAESAAFFRSVSYRDEVTALGDGLRDLLAKTRGQALAGIVVISDGANNHGSSPIEAAALAQQDGVPLFVYGVGVSAAPDIVLVEMVAPPTSSVKEKVDVTIRLRAQGLVGQHSTVQLKANGRAVAEERVEFRSDGEQEIRLTFTPAEIGDYALAASVAVLPEDSVATTNTASHRLRVIDDKLDVLLVQTEPNWDFQYLLAMLQRDRRIRVRCVLLKGDQGLAATPGSPFLAALPDGKVALFANDVIILGDVAPADLGQGRLTLLHEWVSNLGGGLIFLAGPRYNLAAYAGTPLGPVLPVEPSAKPVESYREAVSLQLTPLGANSPLLKLADNPLENEARWNSFPGVRWTAPVASARPGAQVLLVDPTPARASRGGELPVMALQRYGAGQALYVGTTETYRWRAGVGEKYYTQLWSQIVQALASRRNPEGTVRTQLALDRVEYFAGDRMRISARLLKPDFEPLTESEVVGTIVAIGEGSGVGFARALNVRLQAVPNRPGEFRGEAAAPATEGQYTLSLAHDPKVEVRFRAKATNLELAEIALREKALRAMAAAGGGRFLREEDLHQLPEQIAAEATRLVNFKKVPMTLTPWLLGVMGFAACAEWFWRRRKDLK